MQKFSLWLFLVEKWIRFKQKPLITVCKEITSDEVARTAVIISAPTKTPAVAAASEAATRARAASILLELSWNSLSNSCKLHELNFRWRSIRGACRPARTILKLVGKITLKPINVIKWGNKTIWIPNFILKIVIKRSHFSAKFGWDKSQPSPYAPPGLGATEGNGPRQRQH